MMVMLMVLVLLVVMVMVLFEEDGDGGGEGDDDGDGDVDDRHIQARQQQLTTGKQQCLRRANHSQVVWQDDAGIHEVQALHPSLVLHQSHALEVLHVIIVHYNMWM